MESYKNQFPYPNFNFWDQPVKLVLSWDNFWKVTTLWFVTKDRACFFLISVCNVFRCLRMDTDTFTDLVRRVTPLILRQDIHLRGKLRQGRWLHTRTLARSGNVGGCLCSTVFFKNSIVGDCVEPCPRNPN